MLGFSPNADLDSIARSEFDRSASAYGWYESRRISVVHSEKGLAMARSLESKRVIPLDVGPEEHRHSKGGQQAGQEVATDVDRQSPGDLARLEFRVRRDGE